MKIMIEVSGGVVSNIVSTGEVEIYLIDHDNIKAGYEAIPCLIEPMHPGEYLNTKEGGHVAIPGGSECPEFDECLKEALEPYQELTCCDICGGEHPVGFDGDCRDDANRYPKAEVIA